MKPIFRHIPLQAFGTKPLLAIRDIAAVVHNYHLFQQRAEATGSICAAVGKISLGAATIDVTDVPEAVLARFSYAEVVGPNVDIKMLADQAGCYEILAALGRPNPKIADYTLERFEQAFGGAG